MRKEDKARNQEIEPTNFFPRVQLLLVLRPEHDPPGSTARQGRISRARRRAPTCLRRRDPIPSKASAAVALVPVLHTREGVPRVIARPCARRRRVVAQQVDLGVVEDARRRVLGAPPRIAQAGREGLACGGPLIQLDAPRAAARERAVARARRRTLRGRVVRWR